MPSERKTEASSEIKVGWVNGLLISTLIVLPALFGAVGKPTEMGVMIVACALALAFANISRLQSFKGAGFEAHMHRVEKAVGEAYATIDQMHKLARPLVFTNVAGLAYGNQWKGPGFALENQMMRDLRSVHTMVVPEGDKSVEQMFADFYRDNSFHLLAKLKAKVGGYTVEELPNASALDALCSSREGHEPPTIEALRDAIRGLSPETQVRLEPYLLDYEHYRQHEAPRRPVTGSHSDY